MIVFYSDLSPLFKFDNYDSFQIIFGAIIFITSRLWRSSSEEQGDLKSIKAQRSMRFLLIKCVFFCLSSCLLAQLFCMTDIAVCNEVHHQVFVCKGWISYKKHKIFNKKFKYHIVRMPFTLDALQILWSNKFDFNTIWLFSIQRTICVEVNFLLLSRLLLTLDFNTF